MKNLQYNKYNVIIYCILILYLDMSILCVSHLVSLNLIPAPVYGDAPFPSSVHLIFLSPTNEIIHYYFLAVPVIFTYNNVF